MAPFLNEIVIKSLRNAANTPGEMPSTASLALRGRVTHTTFLLHRIQHFNLNPTSLPKATLQLINTSIHPIFLALADENVSLHKVSSLSLSLLGTCRVDHGQGSDPVELVVTWKCPMEQTGPPVPWNGQTPDNHLLKVARFWFKTGSVIQDWNTLFSVNTKQLGNSRQADGSTKINI